MAVLPLVWLALLQVAGVGRGTAWWWLGSAFGVSWLADWAAHWVHPVAISAVYPVTQAAMIGAVFLSRAEARCFLGVLIATGLAAAVSGQLPDVLLHTVAWLGLVGILWPLPHGSLRSAMLLLFGVGWLAWLGYVLRPGWTSWGLYQSIRAVSIAWFCWAAYRPVRMAVA